MNAAAFADMIDTKPIDVSQVLGAPLTARAGSWDANDVILYHLGLNAGADPVASDDLAYTYEPRLHVLPTFGVIPASPLLPEMLRLPGMDVDLANILHGEQDLEIHEPLRARPHHSRGQRQADARGHRPQRAPGL